MADPITIGLAGISIASKIFGNNAARKAARLQRDATIKSARESSAFQLAQLQQRAKQEQAASQLDSQNQRELSLAEIGLSQASAADSNVAGASVDAATSSLKRRANIAQDITVSNMDAAIDQLVQTALGVRVERDSRISNARLGVPSAAASTIDSLGFAAQTLIPLIRG